jgi:ribosomal protein S12 methylthiotransferase
MPGQISMRVKERRRHRLLERQRDISWAFNQRLIGHRLAVLIDGYSEVEQMWEGRYEGQAPEIDGVVYVQGERLTPGTFVEVEVTEATEYDLMARPVIALDGRLP